MIQKYINDDKRWYINGEYYTEEAFKNLLTKDSIDGKVIEVDGKKYKLVAQ